MPFLVGLNANNNQHRAIVARISQASLRTSFKTDPAGTTKEVKKLISGAFAFRRYEPPTTDELVEMAGALTMRLARDHGGLLWQELKTIFENGVEKKYGDFYGLSLGTFLDWVNAYEDTHEHDRLIKSLYTRFEAEALKALPMHAGADDTRTTLNRDYGKYRESVLARENQRVRFEAAGFQTIAGGFRKMNPNPEYQCGSPLWDYEGTESAGARARWMNEHGFPGANLKDIFDNMIRKGIESF